MDHLAQEVSTLIIKVGIKRLPELKIGPAIPKAFTETMYSFGKEYHDWVQELFPGSEQFKIALDKAGNTVINFKLQAVEWLEGGVLA